MEHAEERNEDTSADDSSSDDGYEEKVIEDETGESEPVLVPRKEVRLSLDIF